MPILLQFAREAEADLLSQNEYASILAKRVNEEKAKKSELRSKPSFCPLLDKEDANTWHQSDARRRCGSDVCTIRATDMALSIELLPANATRDLRSLAEKH